MKKIILAICVFVLTGAEIIYAQSNINVYGFSFDLGATFPSEDGFDTGLGFNVNGHYYLGNIEVGLTYSYDEPKIGISDIDFSIYGFNANLTVPFAPSSATTPFIKGGVGFYKAKAEDAVSNLESDWKFGYMVGAGFRFIPQQWRNTFFKIEGTYRGIAFDETWNNFGVTAGVGFNL